MDPKPTPDELDPSTYYVILGPYGGYWCPASQGYTHELLLAGAFTKKELEKEVPHEPRKDKIIALPSKLEALEKTSYRGRRVMDVVPLGPCDPVYGTAKLRVAPDDEVKRFSICLEELDDGAVEVVYEVTAANGEGSTGRKMHEEAIAAVDEAIRLLQDLRVQFIVHTEEPHG